MLEGEQNYESRSNLVNSKDNFVFTGGNHGKFTNYVKNLAISELWECSVGFCQLSTALWIHTLAQNSNPA